MLALLVGAAMLGRSTKNSSYTLSMVLEEKDVRGMVRLLGEVAALDGGHAERKRVLMEGLCNLLEINAWVWALGCQIKPGEAQIYVNYLHGGFDDDRYVKLITAVEHPIMGTIVEPFFTELKLTGRQATRIRDEIDPQGFAMKDGVRELWEAADIGSLILSYYPLDRDSMSCIALYRRLNDPNFTAREKQIAHIILSEVTWLHMSGWPEDRGAKVPKLYPRQRIVLNLLLDGRDRKQIATQMGITENTVSGYTKDVYRHFGVNSHVELMRKFLHANVD